MRMEQVLIEGLGRDAVAAPALADLYEDADKGKAAETVRAADWGAATAALARANRRRRTGILSNGDLLAVCRAAWEGMWFGVESWEWARSRCRRDGLVIHGCVQEPDWAVASEDRASLAWVSADAAPKSRRLSLALAVRIGDRLALDVGSCKFSPFWDPDLNRVAPWEVWEDELDPEGIPIAGIHARPCEWWHRLRAWAERRMAAPRGRTLARKLATCHAG
jgi:hypothetical protein